MITIWHDAWENIYEESNNLNGKVIVINGVPKQDKFKGQKVLYSTEKTKLYII